MDEFPAGARPPLPGGTGATRPVFQYDGRISELYGIFLLNLLLTIVTLGIFRFWAITRIRRYLWSHMRFEGTRFTYTGLGKELFLGFLLAMLILGMFFGGAALIGVALAKIHPALAAIPLVLAYVCVFILIGAARFSAQRYRLSRTEWRGIRGGMRGSALRYGAKWALYLLLVILTLYQAVPWMQVGLARARINASLFGSAVFRCQARARSLYWSWLGTIVGSVLLLGVIGGVIFAAEWATLQPLFTDTPAGPDAEAAIRRALPLIILGFVIFTVLSSLLATWYWARMVRLVTGHTALTIEGSPDTLRFSSTVNSRNLLWLLVSNLLIGLLTLGFGVPIVLHRSFKFLARTTHMSGVLNAEALAQNNLGRPGTGEGMLQAFEPGIV